MWLIDPALNDGYPIIIGFPSSSVKTGWTNNDTISLPHSIWRIASDVNEGYPYTWDLIAIESGYIYDKNVVIGSDIAYKEWVRTHGGGGDDDPQHQGAIDLNGHGVPIAGGFQTYAVYPTDFEGIINKLNSDISLLSTGDTYEDVQKEKFKLFLGNEPYACIVGAKLLPFSPEYIGDFNTMAQNVKIGNWDSEITARKVHLKSSVAELVWNDPISIPKQFNCFLDYEPYTTLTLELPYASSVSLPSEIFVGHTLFVKSAIDIFANTIMHYIFADNILYTTQAGNCCFDYPIVTYSGKDYANTIWECNNAYQSNVFNTTKSVLGGIQSGLISRAIHPPKGSVNLQETAAYASAAVSLTQGIFQGRNIRTYTKSQAPSPAIVQSGSGNVNFSGIQHPVLVIHSPMYISGYNEETFSKLNGFACHHTDKIGNFTGYTEITGIDLAFDAPTDVKQAIAEALSEGVIL